MIRAAICPACGTTYLIKEGCTRCNPVPPVRVRKYTRKGIESPRRQESTRAEVAREGEGTVRRMTKETASPERAIQGPLFA